MRQASSAHRTLLLFVDRNLDAFFAKDMAAFGDFRFVVGAVDHVFEADGALAAFGGEFGDEFGMQSETFGGFEIRRCIAVAPAVGVVAQVVVEDFACLAETSGGLVDVVDVFGD